MDMKFTTEHVAEISVAAFSMGVIIGMVIMKIILI